jgi:hypothetical protein
VTSIGFTGFLCPMRWCLDLSCTRCEPRASLRQRSKNWARLNSR